MTLRHPTSAVVIGGGTGSFTILSSLKKHVHSVTALVCMADDGGSTGVLRDELGILPPGDVRQCLVALSDSPKLRDLFNYRFAEGTFKGHPLGNVLLSGMEKMTGDFNEAIEMASEILRIKGTVVPVTLDNVRLKMEWPEASVILHGERVIDAKYFEHDPRRATLSLVPKPAVNPAALEAIAAADLIVVAPGDVYTSLGALLIVDGIGAALEKAKAPVVYICNLVTKKGQTAGFTVSAHADELERLAGAPFIDYVLFNQQQPNEALAERYREEEAYLVEVDKLLLNKRHYQAIGGDFLGSIASAHKGDSLPVTRSLIRHDADAVAGCLISLYNAT